MYDSRSTVRYRIREARSRNGRQLKLARIEAVGSERMTSRLDDTECSCAVNNDSTLCDSPLLLSNDSTFHHGYQRDFYEAIGHAMSDFSRKTQEVQKAIIQSSGADSLLKNFTKVDRFADDALPDVWKWTWKLENVIYKCISDRHCQDITDNKATPEMRSSILLLKSLYLKRLSELTIQSPSQPQCYEGGRQGIEYIRGQGIEYIRGVYEGGGQGIEYIRGVYEGGGQGIEYIRGVYEGGGQGIEYIRGQGIEYIRGVTVLGLEQENDSITGCTYVIRVYMTAVGHQMLSKDNIICSTMKRTTGIVRPRKSFTSSDDDSRKCEEAALQSFRDEVKMLSSQAFSQSSAASAWRVSTLKVSSTALLALYTEVSTLLGEDSCMAQILPVPDASLWQERQQEASSESIAYQDDDDDDGVGPMDDSRQRSFNSISQYIESLFALLQTVESVAGDSTTQRLGDLLRKILKSFLEVNQGGHAVQSQETQLLLRPLSRPRWVESERSVLDMQQFRCYGCGSSLHRPNGIDSVVGLSTFLHRRTPTRNYAYCHFYRAYYCTQWCHSGNKRTIPRDLVYDWNRDELEVSAQAMYFLDSIHDVPFWNLAEVNPGVYKQVPIAMRVHQLKAELSKAFAARVLGCCTVEAFEEVKRVITEDHYAEHKAHYFVTDSTTRCDLYSLRDLMHMHDGSLPVELDELLGKLNSICT